MAVTLRATMKHIQAHLQALALFSGVTLAEPKAAVEGMHAAVLRSDSVIPQVTLQSTIETRGVLVRLYVSFLREPQGDIDADLDEAEALVKEKLLGNYRLDGAEGIRAIEPAKITVRYGYVNINNIMFRIADMIIPLTVDGNATFAP